MLWSPQALSVWGKISPNDGAWLPLVIHLEDTAGVAAYLWDVFLPHSERELLSALTGFPADEVRSLIIWLAGVHDIGKATPAFAAKAQFTMPGLLDVMRDLGMDARSTREDRLVPHATAGQVILSEWLAVEVPESKKRTRATFACVVGCHHGSTPSAGQVELAELHPAQLGKGVWAEVRSEILGRMAQTTNAAVSLPHWLARRLPLSAQALLSGIVIMADWIASNTDYFPYIDRENFDSASRHEGRLKSALAQLDLPAAWVAAGSPAVLAEHLHSRFPELVTHSPRLLQRGLVELARQASNPGLFIVEGPMGVGKTEAALLAAEVLAERFHLGGVYVGLPTMATANPMFDRVLSWLKRTTGSQASIALAHGKASLNDSFTGLVRHAWQGEIYDEEEGRPSVSVNSWLRGRKRSGLATFVVGTIDQSLFAALKAKHAVLRHLGLAAKVVIIDEVHAADDYMREYLKVLLAWMGAYGTPVILMSATLPPEQRDELISAYSGRSDLATIRDDIYPRITSFTGELDTCAPGADGESVEVRVELLSDDLSDLVALLQERLVDGGCAGVVCNTVSRAQEAFEAVAAAFHAEVLLVHSRFISTERATKEASLVQVLGRKAVRRPRRLIVVGTQVLEQSLDVDFDLLVTDLAPADLILQRAGRLHRHERSGRPTLVNTPVIWVRGVDDWAASPPSPVRGSQAVYGESRLLRAADAVCKREVLRLPEDIPKVVRLAYDSSAIAPEGWGDRWNIAENREFRQRMKAIARAQTYLLALPGENENLNGLIDVRSDDPDSSEARGRSQVRDSDEGLEVMVLWKCDQGLRLPPGHPLSDREITVGVQWGAAEEDLARAMASCTLRLPAVMCFPNVVDRVIAALESAVDYSGWQESRWIAGQLALIFDAQGCCEVAGFHLAYDPERGLRFTPPEESQ